MPICYVARHYAKFSFTLSFSLKFAMTKIIEACRMMLFDY